MGLDAWDVSYQMIEEWVGEGLPDGFSLRRRNHEVIWNCVGEVTREVTTCVLPWLSGSKYIVRSCWLLRVAAKLYPVRYSDATREDFFHEVTRMSEADPWWVRPSCLM